MHLDLIVDQMKNIYLLNDEMEDEDHLLMENQVKELKERIKKINK